MRDYVLRILRFIQISHFTLHTSHFKMIFSKSTLLHLRIPFSIFLMPIFLFAFSQSEIPNNYTFEKYILNIIIIFISIHIFLYPASNGYNSYFDKDEDSIGGLEKPPKVEKDLYYAALLFDLVAILLGLLVSVDFAVMLFIYGLISKAYSHPFIRLKQYPIISLLTVGFFQGFFVYVMCFIALNDFDLYRLFLSVTELHKVYIEVLSFRLFIPAFLAMFLLFGSYPMTQIYQHKEDSKRGDKTISLLLGIKGTFYFVGIMFFIANLGFLGYFYYLEDFTSLIIFEVCLLPILAYFTYWFMLVGKDEKNANFQHTMRLNVLSSICMSIAFLLMKFI